MSTIGKQQSDALEALVEKSYKLFQFPESPSIRKEFCTNLAVVALGIRTGYLIDSFSPGEGIHSLQRLLTTLRLESSRFNDVRLVYVAGHEQYFFVNLFLLRERASALCCESSVSNRLEEPVTTFVLLDKVETIIEPPPDVIQSIKQIVDNIEDPVHLPEGLTAKTLIPLTGFLLEFPVAYVPSSADSSDFLSGVPLDVYECTITPNKTGENPFVRDHNLLKFSCPVHLGVSLGGPDRITKDLGALFRKRLKKASCPWSLKVNHLVVTRDRVAL